MRWLNVRPPTPPQNFYLSRSARGKTSTSSMEFTLSRTVESHGREAKRVGSFDGRSTAVTTKSNVQHERTSRALPPSCRAAQAAANGSTDYRRAGVVGAAASRHPWFTDWARRDGSLNNGSNGSHGPGASAIEALAASSCSQSTDSADPPPAGLRRYISPFYAPTLDVDETTSESEIERWLSTVCLRPFDGPDVWACSESSTQV